MASFDLDYPRAVLLALVVVTGIAIVVAASTSSASFGVYNAAWNGASELRAQADEAGTESDIVRNTTAYGDVEANGTVAVVLSPDAGYGPGEVARVRQFVASGGTLVVAEDFGSHGNDLLAGVGATARVDGRLLRDDRYNYRSPAMPIARGVSNRSLTRGVEQVTLNYGTGVEPNGATVLVNTSGYAYFDENGNEELDENETLGTYPVATVERVGNGSVIVLGDPSALINVMVERPGNRAFVGNLFGAHERVLLDYSHVRGFPPLALALLVLRDSIVLQLALGVGGIAAIGLWTRGAHERLVRIVNRRREGRYSSRPVNEAEIEAFVERRHPDWEEERVRRVLRGILNRGGETDDDE